MQSTLCDTAEITLKAQRWADEGLEGKQQDDEEMAKAKYQLICVLTGASASLSSSGSQSPSAAKSSVLIPR